jgi:hypothetical protein
MITEVNYKAHLMRYQLLDGIKLACSDIKTIYTRQRGFIKIETARIVPSFCS